MEYRISIVNQGMLEQNVTVNGERVPQVGEEVRINNSGYVVETITTMITQNVGVPVVVVHPKGAGVDAVIGYYNKQQT